MLDVFSGSKREKFLEFLNQEEPNNIMRNKGRFVASFGWTDTGDLVTEFGVVAPYKVGELQRTMDAVKQAGAQVFLGKSGSRSSYVELEQLEQN